MKKILILALLLAWGILGAAKLTLTRYASPRKPLQHPHTNLLNKQPDLSNQRRDGNPQKLLVILVDFQQESADDPNTTGNGKFLLQEDPAYLYPIGRPPHDRVYFERNLEALRYYYLAASNGSFRLEYDVYPRDGTAYTLPQPMGYYNPPYADSDLFVARAEEYFRSSFELADNLTPEIDFAQYGHFMIIHAGSDWQHDILGDTPSDIPSFYITVGPGKEAVVDGGAVLIGNACNVPSMISQDFYTQTENGQTYHGGYGALNAVLAHEFGHSVGMADLYNVRTFQPMVGTFDIMDSGGSGILVDVLENDDQVLVEGILPALPGAWSREQAFGEFLRGNGNLLELSQTELYTQLNLAASSLKQGSTANQPQIYKVPLSEGEYLLLENRSVDPDGDGGTAVKATEDLRVVLYPTPYDDPADTPTYEYDYLLPSFIMANGSSAGGGLLAWRINDNLIRNQGVTDSQGNWYSNYENNTVNTLYSNRGVQIIEADNLEDIGNPYSWYWTGTPYEYFHKKRPTLDGYGNFVAWSQEDWKPRLSSSTEPPLLDSQGLGSLHWIDDIGNPSPVMNLKLKAGFFSSGQILPIGEPDLIAGPAIQTSFDPFPCLPLLYRDSITLLNYNVGDWTDLLGSFPLADTLSADFPLVKTNQNGNNYEELAVVHGNSVTLLEFAEDALDARSVNYPDPITAAPLAIGDTMYVCTATSLSAVSGGLIAGYVEAPGIQRLARFGNNIAGLAADRLYLVDHTNLQILAIYELPGLFGNYEPVSYETFGDPIVRMLFLMSDAGDLYKFESGQFTRLFHNLSADLPTQPGITALGPNGLNYSPNTVEPIVFWAAGSRVYAVKADGTLLDGKPFDASPLRFAPGEHVYSINFDASTYLYFPVPGHGHVAFAEDNSIHWDLSLPALTNGSQPQFVFLTTDFESPTQCWYFTDPQGDLNVMSTVVDPLQFRINWMGFRNAAAGCYYGPAVQDPPPPEPEFTAFVYPSPVRKDTFRVRVNNFNAELRAQIFDIGGALVLSQTYPPNGFLERDLQFDSSRLASGVYILSVECGGRRARVKFAVEK